MVTVETGTWSPRMPDWYSGTDETTDERENNEAE